MTAQEYLGQAYKIDKQISSKLKKAELLRKSLYGRGLNYENNEGSSPNSSGDAIGRAVARVVDYEREADEMIDRLTELRVEIEKVISSIKDEKLREVLEHRYLYFESWDQIAANMSYSVRTIYRLHDTALQAVSESCQ